MHVRPDLLRSYETRSGIPTAPYTCVRLTAPVRGRNAVLDVASESARKSQIWGVRGEGPDHRAHLYRGGPGGLPAGLVGYLPTRNVASRSGRPTPERVRYWQTKLPGTGPESRTSARDAKGTIARRARPAKRLCPTTVSRTNVSARSRSRYGFARTY